MRRWLLLLAVLGCDDEPAATPGDAAPADAVVDASPDAGLDAALDAAPDGPLPDAALPDGPLPDFPPPEPTCERACTRVTACARDQDLCPGFEEEVLRRLRNACLDVCTQAAAERVEAAADCRESVRVASEESEEFAALCVGPPPAPDAAPPPPPDAGPDAAPLAPSNSDYEPDAPDEPYELALGDPVRFELPEGDVDWFLVEVGAGVLTATVTSEACVEATTVALTDDVGEQTLAEAAGACEGLTHEVEGGLYLLRVSAEVAVGWRAVVAMVE